MDLVIPAPSLGNMECSMAYDSCINLQVSINYRFGGISKYDPSKSSVFLSVYPTTASVDSPGGSYYPVMLNVEPDLGRNVFVFLREVHILPLYW